MIEFMIIYGIFSVLIGWVITIAFIKFADEDSIFEFISIFAIITIIIATFICVICIKNDYVTYIKDNPAIEIQIEKYKTEYDICMEFEKDNNNDVINMEDNNQITTCSKAKSNLEEVKKTQEYYKNIWGK